MQATQATLTSNLLQASLCNFLQTMNDDQVTDYRAERLPVEEIRAGLTNNIYFRVHQLSDNLPTAGGAYMFRLDEPPETVLEAMGLEPVHFAFDDSTTVYKFGIAPSGIANRSFMLISTFVNGGPLSTIQRRHSATGNTETTTRPINFSAIGRHFNISRDTVRRIYYQRHDIEPRPQGRPRLTPVVPAPVARPPYRAEEEDIGVVVAAVFSPRLPHEPDALLTIEGYIDGATQTLYISMYVISCRSLIDAIIRAAR